MTLVDHLSRYAPADWTSAIEALAREIHPIDVIATRVWFAFFPLELHLALTGAAGQAVPGEEAALVGALGLMGKWRLADQIDTTHTFFHGHRYWPQVKRSVLLVAKELSWPDGLAALVERTADHASRTASVDRDQLLGITAAALMTLRQAGMDAFAQSKGAVQLSPQAHARSIKQILAARGRDTSQGPLGFLRGRNKRWKMTFDENDPAATFELIAGQDLASAAQSDQREYRSKDPRCIPNEGPIPVECRAASCGTCWIGVLGGAEKLSNVDPKDEGKRMKVFGYVKTDEPRPVIRLACQARAEGSVSFVIPPWNGIIGKIRPS